MHASEHGAHEELDYTSLSEQLIWASVPYSKWAALPGSVAVGCTLCY